MTVTRLRRTESNRRRDLRLGLRDDDAGKFQLHHDDVDQHCNRWSARVHDIVRGVSIQGVARVMQFTEPSQRIGNLQQRAFDVVSQSAKQILGRRTQIDDVKMIAQLRSIGFAEHSTTARGQHAVCVRSQIGNRLLFDVPKSDFAFTIEKFANRAADAVLDNLVCVDERELQALTQAPSYCGFSGAGQTDECDRHAGRLTLRAISARRCGR